MAGITDNKLTAFTFNHADQIDQPSPTIYNATQIKQKFDSRASDLQAKYNALIDSLLAVTAGNSGADNVGATAIAGLTGATVQAILGAIKTLVDTKVAITGDFQGTLKGMAITAADPGLSSAFNSHVVDNTQQAINVMYPPSPLLPPKADGTDIAGDTAKLNLIIDYCVANNKRLVIAKDIVVAPTLQTDGSYVCLLVNDEVNNAANTTGFAKGFTIEFIGGATISSTYNLNDYTIIRWKASHGKLKGLRISGEASGAGAKATGIQLCRKKLTDIAELDFIAYNEFDDISFYNLKNGITMEGSVYYNEFRNFQFAYVGQMVWLKLTYAVLNALKTNDSGVNRNNFYNFHGGAINGIRIDCGDTNKFYSMSFEGLTGTAVELYDNYPTYNVELTAYNTFYGVTNEANAMNLICNADSNSFIDFESAFVLCNFIKKPLVYIPSGNANSNHMVLQNLYQMGDRNDMGYIKNRTSLVAPLYASNIADNKGLGTDSNAKGFDWRIFSFLATDCVNVASLTFNNATFKAVFKSIGKIVYYNAKFNFTATVTSTSIKIPLPPDLPLDSNLYTFGNTQYLGAPVTVVVGATPYVVPTRYDSSANKIEILLPAGVTNWDASTNSILIDIHYVRDVVINESN